MRSLSIGATPRAGRLLLVCFALFCIPPFAGAQTAPPAEDAPPIRIGSVVLAGYIQYDYRARDEGSANGASDRPDQFYPRRVRLQLFGPLAPGIEWAISAETTGTPVLRDAYVTLDYLPAATLRIGQLVMPYGYERAVISSNTMAFTERALADLAPSRDAGLVLSNERPFFGWLTYGAAIHNGTGQNIPDNNGAKDRLLRLVATPPRAAGLAFGVNAARGDQPEGMRTRLGADLVYERRSYHLGTEFLRERTRDGQETQDGFYAFGSWRFYPKQAVRGLHHLEFAARYARLRGPVVAGQWDLAANYYVHRGLRFMFDVIVPAAGERDGGGAGLHARANLRF